MENKIEKFIQLRDIPLSSAIQEADGNVIVTLVFKNKRASKKTEGTLPLFEAVVNKPSKKEAVLSTTEGVDLYSPELVQKSYMMKMLLPKGKKFVGFGVFSGNSNLSIRRMRDGKVRFTVEKMEYCQNLKTILANAKKLVSNTTPLQVKVIYK